MTVAVADQNCENCYFARMMPVGFRKSASKALRCCHQSPRFVGGTDPVPWPIVEKSDWCGDWKTLEEAAPAEG